MRKPTPDTEVYARLRAARQPDESLAAFARRLRRPTSTVSKWLTSAPALRDDTRRCLLTQLRQLEVAA